MESVRLIDGVLKVEFKIKSGKPGYADACEPYQRTFTVLLDGLNVDTVDVVLIK